MLQFNDLLKTQDDIQAVNQIAAFLAPSEHAAIHNTDIDLVIHAGNAVLETAITACRLAKQKQCPLLFSGGIGHSTQLLIDTVKLLYPEITHDFQSLSEAEITGYLAVELWEFPKEKLILETQSTNCGANAAFSLDQLTALSLSPKKVVIIQDPTMQLRTFVTFQKAWQQSNFETQFYSEPSFVPQLKLLDHQINYANPEIVGLWSPSRFLSLLIGEIPRLRDDEHGYGPKGKDFIPHVDIPKEIEGAYRHLQELIAQEETVQDRKILD